MDGKFIKPKDIAIGGLYEYDYLPDPQNRYPVYDPHPLMLCIRRDGKYAGGINFHYLRKPIRKKIMEALKNKIENGSGSKLIVPANVVQSAYHLYKMENFRSPALLVEPAKYNQKLSAGVHLEGSTAQKQFNVSDAKMAVKNAVWVRKADGQKNTWEIITHNGISNKKVLRILENNKTLTTVRLKRLRTMYGISIHRNLLHGSVF